MPWTLAKELSARGFVATSTEQLGRAGWKDEAWLTWLHSAFSDHGSNPYVLVTYDNAMPLDHAPLLRDYETRVAVIDKRYWERRSDRTERQYLMDTVHRHAHRFAEQPPNTILRYSTSSRPLPLTLPLDTRPDAS